MPANPHMITLAREYREMTQSELATMLSITQGKLSKMESGFLGVSEEMIARIADALKCPTHFFSQEDIIYGAGIGELYHRKRQNISKKALERIYAAINIRTMHIARLLRSSEIPECRIYFHDIDEFDGHVEEIARAVRATWLLPPGPIANVTQAIEQAGGIVVRCDFGTRLLDAISRWIPGMPPLFFVNKDLPPDRWRFTLCHELGHLVMHHAPNTEMELQAHRFAAELLMPADSIKSALYDLTLPKLAELKRYWRTSMGALLKRAEDLGRITARQARYLWMQMSRAGFRTNEPIEIQGQTEEVTTLKELLDLHQGELQYSMPELCHLLAVTVAEFEAMYLPPSHGGSKTRLAVVS